MCSTQQSYAGIHKTHPLFSPQFLRIAVRFRFLLPGVIIRQKLLKEVIAFQSSFFGLHHLHPPVLLSSSCVHIIPPSMPYLTAPPCYAPLPTDSSTVHLVAIHLSSPDPIASANHLFHAPLQYLKRDMPKNRPPRIYQRNQHSTAKHICKR